MKIFLFLFLIVANAVYPQGKDSFRDLSAKEFNALRNTGKNIVVLDVRTPDEVKDGVIPNAVVLDFLQKNFESEVAKLDKTKTYLVYCASGYRSGETVELMKRTGFKEAYNLKTGFDGWLKAGMPVSK